MLFKGFYRCPSSGTWLYNGLTCVDFNHAFQLWRQGLGASNN